MPEQATCKCGRTYSPQDYLTRIADQPSDRARCPACGQELCLATCDCGNPLTSEHRQVSMSHDIWGIARSVVEFKCPSCGKLRVVKLESRKNRGVVALCAAILMGALGAGLTWWAGYSAVPVLLVGAVCALGGAAAFYIRILRPPIR